MSLRIRLATRAEADLRDIMQFSDQRWGRRQRVAYAATLDRTFILLADESGIGRSRDELIPGMRSHPAGSHVIYYLALDDELLVVRVLHDRQDPAREQW